MALGGEVLCFKHCRSPFQAYKIERSLPSADRLDLLPRLDGRKVNGANGIREIGRLILLRPSTEENLPLDPTLMFC